MADQVHTPAGWYPDPRDQRLVRYWDGTRWTAYTQPRVPGPAGAYAPPAGAAARGSSSPAWWQTWWVILPGLVLCLPVGLVPLWLRRGPSNAVKATVSVAAAALVVIALATAPSEEDATPSSAVTARSPGPSASVTPTPSVVTVPAVKGLGADRAQEKIRRADLTVGHITRRPSSARPGTVLAQGLRKGSEVEPGAVVSLVVAILFPRIPPVVGGTAASATAELRQAGYEVRTIVRTQTSGRNGAVLAQSPRGGVRAKQGSLVTLTVLKVVALPPPKPQPANCTPGYSPCLPPAYDYDCAGGSGDGPRYASGPVYVTGYDPYDLDADGDGVACES